MINIKDSNFSIFLSSISRATLIKKKYYNANSTQENCMLTRLKIGLAFRYSRNIVGGLTGFIFSLGTIFKTPFKGKGPAIFMGSLGLSIFMLKTKENYQLERSEVPIDDYKKNKIQSSTVFIATLLTKDSQKLKSFQDKAILISSEQKSKELEINFSHAQLEDILKGILNSRIEYSEKLEDIARRYIHCIATFLAQVGSHFMECLLAKAYEKPDLFDFNEVTADNILIVMLSALSLYNGYQSFKETHAAYDKANIDDICENFLKTYR